MNNIPRHLLKVMLQRIKQEQVIVLTGARQTGKTTLAQSQLPEAARLQSDYLSFDDPDERFRFQKSATAILESLKSPLIILDEVQKIPALFDSLKWVVDRQKHQKSSAQKKFILTGSSQLLLMKNIRETMAGRAALLNLYPFSLSEVAENVNVPFISMLWNAGGIASKDEKLFHTLPVDKIRRTILLRDEHRVWGGYPPVWQKSETADKINWLRDYRRTYLERDVADVGQVSSIDNFALAQKLLCTRTAGILSISEVARDLALAVNTVKRYLSLLSMTFQCFIVPPYYENVGKRLIKSPKIYFPDPGLNKAILGDLSISDGAAYESWVFAELLKWKQLEAVEPELYFYRTSSGLEIDFLIAGQGKILPIEVKLGNRVTAVDGGSLTQFIKEHPKKTTMGLIVYPGREFRQIRENIWAVPDWYLFGGIQ
ncbi:MAG: ATP-binding protein [Smithella sp.]